MVQGTDEDKLIKELIKGCKNNKLKCQELLYKKFFGYALSIAIRYISDRSVAIEIVDDGFMKIFIKIKIFNDNQDFKAWLRRIIINTAIDRIRQIKNNEKFKKLNGMHVLHKSTIHADSKLNSEELISLLKYLPPLHCAVFNLYEIEGFNHREISEQLNIPESSSRTYLTRAKKELRELYKKYFL